MFLWMVFIRERMNVLNIDIDFEMRWVVGRLKYSHTHYFFISAPYSYYTIPLTDRRTYVHTHSVSYKYCM